MDDKLKVVAWMTTGTPKQPNKISPEVCTNSAYKDVHKEWVWQPLVLESEAKAALDAALERVKVLEAGSWPEKLPTRIQVSYSPADWDTFIYGVSGHLTMEALASIDAQLRDEDADSLFDKGPGDYLLSASYFKGQYGFEGRCEIAPGWELSVEDFKPLDAAIDAAMEVKHG